MEESFTETACWEVPISLISDNYVADVYEENQWLIGLNGAGDQTRKNIQSIHILCKLQHLKRK